MYTIGQLSKKTGVTIRTLDYYDQIGLIVPHSKTAGGHRLYSDENVLRLEQVLALKYMNFSLEQIKDVLDSSIRTYKETIEEQLCMVRQEQIRLEALEQALYGVLCSIEFEGETNWHIIFDIIRLFQQDPEAASHLLEEYLTEEEIEKVMSRNQQMTKEELLNWNDTLHEIRSMIGQDPASEEPQRLVKKWLAGLPKRPGNDEQLINKIWEAAKAHKDGIAFYPMDGEIIDFLDEVVQCMGGNIGRLAIQAFYEQEKEEADHT